jgi:HSP20 family protein
MAIVKRDRASTHFVPFERFFGELPTFLHWREMLSAADDLVHVDEYRENRSLVIRAEMAGIDPEKDVEITISKGMLHIGAERRDEMKDEGKDYYRQELRYGSFSRDLPLPEGVTEGDVKATYKNGILEIRVPMPQSEEQKTPTKIKVETD